MFYSTKQRLALLAGASVLTTLSVFAQAPAPSPESGPLRLIDGAQDPSQIEDIVAYPLLFVAVAVPSRPGSELAVSQIAQTTHYLKNIGLDGGQSALVRSAADLYVTQNKALSDAYLRAGVRTHEALVALQNARTEVTQHIISALKSGLGPRAAQVLQDYVDKKIKPTTTTYYMEK